MSMFGIRSPTNPDALISLRSGNRVERTPPTGSIKANDKEESSKRRAEEDLENINENMCDKLMNRFNTLSHQIKEMESKFERKMDEKLDEKTNDISKQIKDLELNVEKKIDEKFGIFKEFMDNTDKKLKDVEKKIEMNNNASMENSRAINALNQKELMNKIDIVGVKWPNSIKRETIKEEVVKVMNTCNIKLELSDVKAAFLRKTKASRGHVMMVEFADFETKLRVIKEKRMQKVKDGIYFDNTLTYTNVKLMIEARKIAKDKNFKAYLNNNRVCIRQSNENMKYIMSEDDLEVVKQWKSNEEKNDPIKNSNSDMVISPGSSNSNVISTSSQ